MKQNLSVIAAFILAFTGLIGYSAKAQDGNPPYNEEKEIKELNSHPELNLNDDKTLIIETEQAKPSNHTPAKDVITGNKSKPKVNNAKEEKDALSFNFLYYIIEKFKYSDIVD